MQPIQDDSLWFVESNQLSRIKRRGRGCVVAIQLSERMYQLAYCLDCDKLGIVAKTIDMGPQELTKAYMGEDAAGQIKYYPVEKTRRVYFLNMVWASGKWDCLRCFVKKDTTSTKDKCFTFSRTGPDIVRVHADQDQLSKEASSLKQHTFGDDRKGERQDVPPEQCHSLLVYQRSLKHCLRKGTLLIHGKHTTELRLFAVPLPISVPVGSAFALLEEEQLIELMKFHGETLEEFQFQLLILARYILDGFFVMDLTTERWNVISVDWEKPEAGETHERTRFLKLGEVVERFGDKAHVLTAGGPILRPGFHTINMTIIQDIIDLLGAKGCMPNRGRSANMGHQSYIGVRGTTALRDHPLYCNQDAAYHDLYSQTNSLPNQLVSLLPLLNTLTHEATLAGEILHPEHLLAAEKALQRPKECLDNGLCTLRIVTFGLIGMILAFCNTFHSDAKDRMNNEYEEKLNDILEKAANRPLKGPHKRQKNKNGQRGSSPATQQNPPILSKYLVQYLRGWKVRFDGFHCPTTCSYASCGRLPDGAIFYQFFVMDSLRCSARLGERVVKSFFASEFSHCTSVAIVVLNGRVYLYDGSFSLFAWGAGKPRSAASIEQRARDRVRRRRERPEL